jgi:hypothetical protein
MQKTIVFDLPGQTNDKKRSYAIRRYADDAPNIFHVEVAGVKRDVIHINPKTRQYTYNGQTYNKLTTLQKRIADTY